MLADMDILDFIDSSQLSACPEYLYFPDFKSEFNLNDLDFMGMTPPISVVSSPSSGKFCAKTPPSPFTASLTSSMGKASLEGLFPLGHDDSHHELPPSITQELDYLLEQPTLQLDPRQMSVLYSDVEFVDNSKRKAAEELVGLRPKKPALPSRRVQPALGQLETTWPTPTESKAPMAVNPAAIHRKSSASGDKLTPAKKEAKRSHSEPRTGIQRERHSELERIRREELKNAFDSLCKVVPLLSKERTDGSKLPPQAQILNVAIQYIDAIKTRQIELVKVRGHLHEQQVALQTRLRMLCGQGETFYM